MDVSYTDPDITFMTGSGRSKDNITGSKWRTDLKPSWTTENIFTYFFFPCSKVFSNYIIREE